MKSERFGKVHILMYNYEADKSSAVHLSLNTKKRPEPQLFTYKRMRYRVRVAEVEYTL